MGQESAGGGKLQLLTCPADSHPAIALTPVPSSCGWGTNKETKLCIAKPEVEPNLLEPRRDKSATKALS